VPDLVVKPSPASPRMAQTPEILARFVGGWSAALHFFDEGGSANSRKMQILADTDVISINSLNDDGTIKNQIARFNAAALSLGGTLKG
jgi:hypothetical protein